MNLSFHSNLSSWRWLNYFHNHIKNWEKSHMKKDKPKDNLHFIHLQHIGDSDIQNNPVLHGCHWFPVITRFMCIPSKKKSKKYKNSLMHFHLQIKHRNKQRHWKNCYHLHIQATEKKNPNHWTWNVICSSLQLILGGLLQRYGVMKDS